MESAEEAGGKPPNTTADEREKDLCTLPILVQSRILSFLPGLSINSLTRTCQAWRKIIAESPKQCRKPRFDSVRVKSFHKKFKIDVIDEEGTLTSREIPIVKENSSEPLSKKRRVVEGSKEKNEDVRSAFTPEVMSRLEKIAKIGDVKTLYLDSIDMTEEAIDRLVEIFIHVEEIEIAHMDLQQISEEKANKLLFGLGNSKLRISFTWISARLLDDSFWTKCGDRLHELYLDTLIVRNQTAGVPVITDDQFIQLCNRIPSIRFGVTNDLESNTILRLIDNVRAKKQKVHFKIDYGHHDLPIQLLTLSPQHLRIDAVSHTMHYSDPSVNLTMDLNIEMGEIEITRRRGEDKIRATSICDLIENLHYLFFPMAGL